MIGKKIYYDINTGEVLLIMPEMCGEYRETTFEEDYNTYKVLNERLINTIGCIQLEYGQYAEDFSQCNGYRVNPETKQLEFSYPDPNEPEAPQVFRKPLTEELEETKQAIAELTLLLAQMQMGGM
ncbi:hypothetical protein [Brevibacillus sp. MCWH]|uniref:hypothetical protein n=1 Tax=Brevibacillus sp. MCWH TaxID=2508871 RepID=UPI0014921210|nr:hypothetical protein [Brevibacillus sp. MCWH]NNV04771.1 hypothetical protein [Brevibacillus sp. MCWH]